MINPVVLKHLSEEDDEAGHDRYIDAIVLRFTSS